MHRCTGTLEGNGEAHAVSLDIAEAFDRVWHKGLLSKLPSYDFADRLLFGGSKYTSYGQRL